jgi:hypothetical protein
MADESNPFSGYLAGGSDWGSLLLEALPQAAYYSSPTGQAFASPQGRSTPRRQRYFQQGYGDVFNQYMGALGQQIRSGTDPNLTFQSFLESDPWTSRYAQLPQGMRGVNTSMYNPRTRFLYY